MLSSPLKLRDNSFCLDVTGARKANNTFLLGALHLAIAYRFKKASIN